MTDLLLSIWTIFYSVVLAIFLFGITVFVHEFGHFLVARKLGLVVQTFSIGFGKAIWKREKEGILYKIGWIPFGGYVALPQLDPEGMDRIQGAEEKEDFPDVSPWKKIAVAFAGPLSNILFAIVLALAIWLIPGDDAGLQVSSRIGGIETNSTAYASGLRIGDEILSVNGTAVNNWYEFSVETLLQSSDSVALTVRAEGSERELSVPVSDVGGGTRIVDGISPATPCIFGSVIDDSPAERAGIEKGDEALEFNGAQVLGRRHFTELVQEMEPGETAELIVDRDGEELELSIAPEYNEEFECMLVGVRFGSGMPWMLYKNPIKQLKFDALAIVRVLQALTDPDQAPQAAKGLGGPIAIIEMFMIAISMGLVNTLGFVRFININLAILNLLPIPVLDGGHIIFSLWHGITRRKVNPKMQGILIQICAFLLIGAMLLITFNDIDRKLNIKEKVGNLISKDAEAEPQSLE